MELIARNTKQIGDILARFRKNKKSTQTDIGKQTGLRQATISELENGGKGTKLQTLIEVLTALDLEIVIRPRSKSSLSDFEDLF